ncbi:MAG: THUMP domain-containing protein [archaeon]|jgi:thiamine biosynthesis protein ThiI
MIKTSCVIALLAPEISLKSKQVQNRMHEIMKNNIALALKNSDIEYSSVRHKAGRIFFNTTNPKKAIEILKTCFGINLLIESYNLIFNKEKSEDKSLDFVINYGLSVCDKNISGEFAVRAKSFNKYIDARKIELGLGSKILENIKETKVKLSNPHCQCNVIVFENEVFVYFKSVDGAKGMPLGIQGKVAINITNLEQGSELIIKLMKFGCLPVLIKNDLTSKVDLKKYNSYIDLEIVSLDEAKLSFVKNNTKAFFCDTTNLGEKKKFDKLIETKSFAPFLE